MRQVKVVLGIFWIYPKTVVEEKPFAFEERLRIFEIDFEARPVFEFAAFIFKIIWIGNASIFAVEDVLSNKMEIGIIAFVNRIITGGEAKVTCTGKLVDVFAKRAQAFIGEGKIEPFGGVDGNERIERLSLFHDTFKIKVGYRRSNGIIMDIIRCHIIEVFRLVAKFGIG